MIQLQWTARKWSFDFDAGIFPCIIERLRGTPARIGELIRNHSVTRLQKRAGDRWSVNEHIGHLIDLDDLDHVRLSEFIAGAATLSAADMTNKRTHEARYNDVAVNTLLDYFRERRFDLVERLENVSDEQVVGTALHPRLMMHMRLVDWTHFVAEHDDHHVARIREILR